MAGPTPPTADRDNGFLAPQYMTVALGGTLGLIVLELAIPLWAIARLAVPWWIVGGLWTLAALLVYAHVRYLGLLVYDTFNRCRGECLPACEQPRRTAKAPWIDDPVNRRRAELLLKVLRFPRRAADGAQ